MERQKLTVTKKGFQDPWGERSATHRSASETAEKHCSASLGGGDQLWVDTVRERGGIKHSAGK
eukprot:4042810-Amphidinium_carterae.1